MERSGRPPGRFRLERSEVRSGAEVDAPLLSPLSDPPRGMVLHDDDDADSDVAGVFVRKLVRLRRESDLGCTLFDDVAAFIVTHERRAMTND